MLHGCTKTFLRCAIRCFHLTVTRAVVFPPGRHHRKVEPEPVAFCRPSNAQSLTFSSGLADQTENHILFVAPEDGTQIECY